MRLVIISASQIDNQRTWFQKIRQEGCSSRICKHVVLVSGIAFSIIPGLMDFYGRCRESEEITIARLEELSKCVINQDQIEASAREKQTPPQSEFILNWNIFGPFKSLLSILK